MTREETEQLIGSIITRARMNQYAPKTTYIREIMAIIDEQSKPVTNQEGEK